MAPLVDVDLVEVGWAAAGPVASVIVIIKAQQPARAERRVFRLIEALLLFRQTSADLMMRDPPSRTELFLLPFRLR